MKDVSLKSLSIKGNKLKVSYEEFHFETGEVRTITYENAATVHPDLLQAIRSLGYHVASLTGIPLSAGLQVLGYRVQDSGSDYLVTIYSRVVHRGVEKPRTNLTTRIYLVKDAYNWLELLFKSLSQCEKEAFAYIEEGKREHYPDPKRRA